MTRLKYWVVALALIVSLRAGFADGISNPRALFLSSAQQIAQSNQFMFSSNGWRAPTQHYAPGASGLSCVSELWRISDDYWTYNPRFLLANWYLTTSGGGAQEAANGNAVSYGAAAIIVGLNGTPVQLTFTGATSLAQSDDTETWTDPAPLLIPPRTAFAIRLERNVASAALNVASPYPGIQPSAQDKAECSASSLVAKVLAGGIATSLPSGNLQYMPAPIAMIAQGWDGRPVGLGFGTSIEQGVGQSRLMPGPFREIGPFGRGMVSQAGGAIRYPAVTWAVSGGLAAGIIGDGTNQGLTRRIRSLAVLPNIPMTFLYSGFGTNDQTATLATWESTMTTLWAALKGAWPGAPLVQSTLLPRTTSTDGFITATNQTPTTNFVYPTGSAYGLYKWMLQQQAYTIDSALDTLTCADNYPTGIRGTLRTDVLDASWSTTVSGALTAGGTSAVTVAAPRAGEIIAFSDNPEAALINSISGTTTFTSVFSAAIASNHASGATVKQAVTLEGIHPGDLLAQKIADCAYAPAKINGLFLGAAGRFN